LIMLTSSPAACSDRMAASRPAPGPRTRTSTWRRPCSMALRAAVSAATLAAKGVPLRDPLNPTVPALAQAMMFPLGSLIETIVLLKLERMWAVPTGMLFRSRLRALDGLSAMSAPRQDAGLGAGAAAAGLAAGAGDAAAGLAAAFRFTPTVFFGPLRVRALVRVR